MTVTYGKFEMPKKISIDKASVTPTFTRFIIEPFEKGFGHTLGNSLRRIMLSSLESPAIVSIALEGVSHEYMAIDGIMEDMTDIILNLKGALLKLANPTTEYKKIYTISHQIEVTEADLNKRQGKYVVELKEVMKSPLFEVVNPTLPLFVITKPLSKRITLKVDMGRGYVPSEKVNIEDKAVNEIAIDAIFSPVRAVNYYVEYTRVGQATDYDRLVLEVTTDGRVSPQDALSFAAQIALKHLEVFSKIKLYELAFERDKKVSDNGRDEMMQKLALRISEIELSVRSTNCLQNADIRTIAELVIKPESEMLKFRNFGKKSLTEIKGKLTEMGLSLGMDLSRYGMDPTNVRKVINAYLENNVNKEKV